MWKNKEIKEIILKQKYSLQVANTMQLLTNKMYSIAATFNTYTGLHAEI